MRNRRSRLSGRAPRQPHTPRRSPARRREASLDRSQFVAARGHDPLALLHQRDDIEHVGIELEHAREQRRIEERRHGPCLARCCGRIGLNSQNVLTLIAKNSRRERYARGDLGSGFGAQSLTDLGGEILELWRSRANARAPVTEVDADRLITNVGCDHVVKHRVAPAAILGFARRTRGGREQSPGRAAQPDARSRHVLAARLPPLGVNTAGEGLMRRRGQYDRDQGDRDNNECDEREKTRFDAGKRSENAHYGRTELQALLRTPPTVCLFGAGRRFSQSPRPFRWSSRPRVGAQRFIRAPQVHSQPGLRSITLTRTAPACERHSGPERLSMAIVPEALKNKLLAKPPVRTMLSAVLN